MALTDNWEASWRFNNDWTDSSGNGINGSAIGATFSSSTKKLGSHSSVYDGIDDAGNFGNVLNSVFAGADKKFSFSTWVYLNNLDTVQFHFTKYGASGHGENQRQFYARILTNGSAELVVFFNLGISPFRFRIYTTPAGTITAAGFNLIRITYDGSIDTNDGNDRVTIKVNNVDKALSFTSAGALGEIQVGTARLSTGGYIGSSGSTVIGEVDGFIDQTDIWSRILTTADDNAIWNGGAGLEIGLAANVGQLINGGLIDNDLTKGRLVH